MIADHHHGDFGRKEMARPEGAASDCWCVLESSAAADVSPHRLRRTDDHLRLYGSRRKEQKPGKQFQGRIRRIHLHDPDNPYNTYTHEGCRRHRSTIRVERRLWRCWPRTTTPYLYFVSRNDGTHQFSVTLEEHQAAVNKYQRSGHQNAPWADFVAAQGLGAGDKPAVAEAWRA